MDEMIKNLELRINDLIKLCNKMRKENELLQNDQRLLRQEYTQLLEKNKIAYKRVEQIVARIKSLQD